MVKNEINKIEETTLSKMSPEEIEKITNEATELVTKARVQMLSKQPFWGQVCMHLTFEADWKMEHIMGVDPYGHVYFNPAMVLQFSLEEIKGVIAHEVTHCGLEHMERRGQRDPLRWNICADLVVNNMVTQNFKIPSCGINIPSKVGNKCTEELYDELPKETGPMKCPGAPNHCKDCKMQPKDGAKGDVYCDKFDGHSEKKEGKGKDEDGEGEEGDTDKDGKGSGKGKGQIKKDMDKKDSEGNSGGGQKDADKDLHGETKNSKGIRDTANKPNWGKIFREAYEYAKLIGKEPAGMERVFDFMEPQMDWRELLYRYVTQLIPQDLTYSKPHKKSISAGYYFPGIKKEEIEVTAAIDTSGSIGEEELNSFMGILSTIFNQFDAVHLTVMSCDAAVYNIESVTSKMKLRQYRSYGGGGTDFRPVFKWIQKNKPETKVLIYLTDLYGTFPQTNEVPMGLTTLWLVTPQGDKTKAPFGVTIQMPQPRPQRRAYNQ